MKPSSPAADSLLPSPSTVAQGLMAKHLEKHSLVFELEEHVHLGGDRQPSQLLSWNPVNAAFICERCPGHVFQTGEITPTMVRRARLFDDKLQPHLVGLLQPEERDEMTRHYLSGRLNRGRLRRLQGAANRRRSVAASRPAVERQRRQVQEWMLKQRTKLRTDDAVFDAAVRLQEDDPEAWARLAYRRLARETLRKYWHDIDEAKKRHAREVFDRRHRSRRS